MQVLWALEDPFTDTCPQKGLKRVTLALGRLQGRGKLHFIQILRPSPPPLDMNSILRAVSGTY